MTTTTTEPITLPLVHARGATTPINKPDTENSCLNLVLNKIDSEITKFAESAKQTKGDNITKAERLFNLSKMT